MSMKPFIPFLAGTLLISLGSCGLEKPPASMVFPEEKKEAAPTPVPAAPAQAEAPADPKLAAGKTVYDANCAACHDAGMMGAPKPGDKSAWSERIGQGAEVMVKKTIDGFQGKTGMMPAKGGNTSLTNEQMTNAVEFMIDKSK